jgi:GATA-binding protein, other eukaryote
MYDMAASEGLPFTPASPSTAMNPTATEHDYRFPRRPADSSAGSEANRTFTKPYGAENSNSTGTSDTSPGDLRLQELNLELSRTGDSAHHDLLNSSVFPTWQEAATAGKESLDQMQRNDPLATQIWRFFSKTKQSLPSQERMENLTWRMMHMRLRRQQMEEEMARYVSSPRSAIRWGFFPR